MNEKTKKEGMEKDKYQIPTLDLDPNYFEDEIVGGSRGDNGWNLGIMDTGYRSHPTTTISLKTDMYNQELQELYPISSDKDIYIMEDNIGHSSFDNQIKEYGDLARRFLPDYLIEWVEYFDVDNDGKDEQIIAFCGLWGTGCPHKIIIVKNNKIIFSTLGRDINEAENNNGFVLWWEKSYKDPYGYMTTRFIYEDNIFKPVYEQENKYFNVK